METFISFHSPNLHIIYLLYYQSDVAHPEMTRKFYFVIIQISFLRHLLGNNKILSPPDYVCRIFSKAEMKTFMQMCFVQTFFDLRWDFYLFPCQVKTDIFKKLWLFLKGQHFEHGSSLKVYSNQFCREIFLDDPKLHTLDTG